MVTTTDFDDVQNVFILFVIPWLNSLKQKKETLDELSRLYKVTRALGVLRNRSLVSSDS